MRRLVSIVCIALLIATGACGGDDGPDTSSLAERIREVSATTEQAGSAKTSVELAIEAKAKGKDPQETTILAEGEWDFAADEGRASLGVGTIQTETIVIGGVLYTKSPQPADSAKPWTKAPAKGGGRLGTTDPEQALSLLLGATDVEEEGSEEVRGEPTDKYSLAIDLGDAASQLPDGDRQAFEQSAGQLAQGDLPATVWVDAEGRLRRIRYTILNENDDASTSITTTMEFFDFGTEVEVSAPPADQIA